jgi:hypothetical protein
MHGYPARGPDAGHPRIGGLSLLNMLNFGEEKKCKQVFICWPDTTPGMLWSVLEVIGSFQGSDTAAPSMCWFCRA